MSFQKGQMVRIKSNATLNDLLSSVKSSLILRGHEAVVVKRIMHGNYISYGLDFRCPIPGKSLHNLDDRLKTRTGWNVKESALEPAESDEI